MNTHKNWVSTGAIQEVKRAGGDTGFWLNPNIPTFLSNHSATCL